MIISVPLEPQAENRIPLIPESVSKLVKFGFQVKIEKDLGKSCYFTDQDYIAAGAIIEGHRDHLFKEADIVVRINSSTEDELKLCKAGTLHVSFCDPYNQRPLIELAAQLQISLMSMEMIPRTSYAQKMDALSSQASLAGYAAVIAAAERSQKIFPMMMTPAGTIRPCKVFIIGAGVAGLQAIATANRLGARVEAFDTRPVVEEQVQSLGARFVKIDLGETGQTKNGYATALTDDQLARQRELMTEHCKNADIVITTAKLFGRKAPLIITKDMIKAMKGGSVIVDLAVSSGGNVEGSKADEEVIINDVIIIGHDNLPGKVAYHASQMYSSNITHLFTDLFDKESKELKLISSNEIVNSCLITHKGQVVNEQIKSFYNKG
ncbi:MAG: NAD(P) transhydrogenase subunit alpha [Spirochaetales bacterium]|nr:NAD(P) transhydrogenase subunit alpha [Spirochaetales bacterium]